MNIQAIQSEINRLTAELNQLEDVQYYSKEEAAKRKPGLVARIAALENQLRNGINNIEVAE